MNKKKIRLISAICLIAQAFTSFVLSFVYANKKKELSHAFLGFGIVGGLGGAYLLYKDFQESKQERLACEGEDWCDDTEDDFFDEEGADDINFTIADEETEGENEEKTEEKPDQE